jgi:hypothetical protein
MASLSLHCRRLETKLVSNAEGKLNMIGGGCAKPILVEDCWYQRNADTRGMLVLVKRLGGQLTFSWCVPHGHAPHKCASHVHLMGMYLIGVSHGHAPHRHASHGRAPQQLTWPSLPDQVKRRRPLTSACSNKSVGYLSSGYTADAACSSISYVVV